MVTAFVYPRTRTVVLVFVNEPWSTICLCAESRGDIAFTRCALSIDLLSKYRNAKNKAATSTTIVKTTFKFRFLSNDEWSYRDTAHVKRLCRTKV